MSMKKIAPLAITALLFSGAAVASANEAVDTNAITQNIAMEQAQIQPSFIKVTGIVEEVEVRNYGTYYTIKDGENINGFAVSKETLVFDNTGKVATLQKGDRVTAYTYANKPMILIYPPQYSPEVVILETAEPGNVAVDFFDKDLVNLDYMLKLNIGTETSIQSLSGKAVNANDVAKKYVLAFYTVTTKSIPAQTVPSKVVILDTITEMPIQVTIQDIIEKDFYQVNGTTMVPLRIIAEKLGYQVTSTGKGAIISKGAVSFTITRGEKTYGYNKALLQFNVAPALLEPGKTYVPEEFVEELMKQ